MNTNLDMLFDLITFFFLAFGLFFMTVGAVGLLKLPDMYHRMHAATKGVTLGISGMLLATLFYLPAHQDASAIEICTKIVLVILFQFVANPVGAHLLAKAAHLDGCPMWEGTLSDELGEDADR